MQLDEMRTLFRNYFNDPNGDLISDAEILVLLNRGQEEVQKMVEAVQEDYFSACQNYAVTPDADSYEFALASDFKKLLLAEKVVEGGSAVPARRVPFSRRNVSVNDYCEPLYYLRGTKLGVVRPFESYTLRVFYQKRLADLAAGTDLSEIPKENHNLIVLHAVKLAFAGHGRDFVRWQDEYNMEISRLSLALDARAADQPSYVHVEAD